MEECVRQSDYINKGRHTYFRLESVPIRNKEKRFCKILQEVEIEKYNFENFEGISNESIESEKVGNNNTGHGKDETNDQNSELSENNDSKLGDSGRFKRKTSISINGKVIPIIVKEISIDESREHKQEKGVLSDQERNRARTLSEDYRNYTEDIAQSIQNSLAFKSSISSLESAFHSNDENHNGNLFDLKGTEEKLDVFSAPSETTKEILNNNNNKHNFGNISSDSLEKILSSENCGLKNSISQNHVKEMETYNDLRNASKYPERFDGLLNQKDNLKTDYRDKLFQTNADLQNNTNKISYQNICSDQKNEILITNANDKKNLEQVDDIEQDCTHQEKKRNLVPVKRRKRSLSVGGKILPLQEGSGEDLHGSTQSRSWNNLINIEKANTCYSSAEESDTPTDKAEKIKEFNRRSFIGKSISVDIYHKDQGFSSSKVRRNGLINFDSKSFDSNTDDDEFLAGLADFKKNYKKQKKRESSGLKFAKSVENLLKLDKGGDAIQRSRSNTEIVDVKPDSKKSTKSNKKFFPKYNKTMDNLRETSLLDDEYSLDISVERVTKIAGIIEMYLDQDGNVIRKVEIQKVPGQSLGFFIRFGNGIERLDGIFISRVTLGSFADVNNLLHAGDQIIEINKVDATGLTLEEVAEIMQSTKVLIIKTRSALPLPLHAQPLLTSYQRIEDIRFPGLQTRFSDTQPQQTLTINRHKELTRTKSDPASVIYNTLNNSRRDRSQTGYPEDINNNYTENTNMKDKQKNKIGFKNVKQGPRSPQAYRQFAKEIITVNENITASNFSRAEKYKAPPIIEVEEVRTNKTTKSFIKSPKLFRKSEKKNNSEAPKFFMTIDNLSSSASDTDDNNSENYEKYKSDSTVYDRKEIKSYSGKLTVNIIKILNFKLRANSTELMISKETVGSKDECFCTVEVDGECKATTQCQRIKNNILFDESFELELRNSHAITFYIFLKSEKQKQNRLLNEGCIHLENFFKINPNNNKSKKFILKTDVHTDIKLSIDFVEAKNLLQRTPSTRSSGVFGFNLSQTLVKEENTIPILVRKCVEEIEKRGLNLTGIYRISGNAKKKKFLRQQFEEFSSNVDVSEEAGIDCHVLSGLLKDYLRELPNPLISQEIYLNLYNKSLEHKKILADSVIPENPELDSTDLGNGHSKKRVSRQNDRILMDLMKKLPLANRATLIFIMEHLHRIIEHKEDNKMDEKNLAICFGPTMMCPPINSNAISEVFDFKKQIQALEFLFKIWPQKVAQNKI